MRNYKKKIAKGELKLVLDDLLNEESLQEAEYNQVVMINTRLSDLEKQIRGGTIREEESSIQGQQIAKSLLEFLDLIEGNREKRIRSSNDYEEVGGNIQLARLPILLGSLIIVGILVFGFWSLYSTQAISGESEPTTIIVTDTPQVVYDKFDSTRLKRYHKIPIINYEMVRVERDTFTMGTDSIVGVNSERPPHKVLMNPFYIGKFEMTQFQWSKLMSDNPSENIGCLNCPVENMTWYDIQFFIDTLEALTGQKYSLPSEAQWEYAAKGGQYHEACIYSGCHNDSLFQFAWYEENPNSTSKTQPVGSLKPNKLGLYDMSGNVHEYCKDWFKYDYYTPAFTYNPVGPDSLNSNGTKIFRGGAFNRPGRICRVTRRAGYNPMDPCDNIGFRLVLN